MAHHSAQTFNGRKRIRKFFGHIREVAEMPNLIEVQKASYDQFLLVDEPEGGRPDEGLQSVFKSVFPIADFSNTSLLEFVKYEFEPPKYDVDECRQRGMTFAAPLKVTLRLIVFDVDPDTAARVGQGHQGAGRLYGRHAPDDDERHLHRQRHRARHRLADASFAGRVLRSRQGQEPFLGQAPVRGAHHPLSRLLARHRVRRQGHRLCAHRPSPQDSRDLGALCARHGRRGDPVDLLQDRAHDARQGRLASALRPGAPQGHEGRRRHARRRDRRGRARSRQEAHRAHRAPARRTRRSSSCARRTRTSTASISPTIFTIRRPAKSSPKPATKSAPRSCRC